MTGEAGGAMPSRRLELVPADELKAALADGVRAQHEAGDLQASRDSFERAYRLAERAGDAESMALAALGLAGLWVAERRTVTSTVLLEARLQHVLALLDPRSALALRVRTRLAGEADYARGTHAAVLAALDEVRAAGDPELLAEALRIAHQNLATFCTDLSEACEILGEVRVISPEMLVRGGPQTPGGITSYTRLICLPRDHRNRLESHASSGAVGSA